METRGFRDLRFSTLMLGTVQFGLPYGIANRTGQPSYAQVLDILRAAAEGGVNCLDTAAVYGTSEEVLGRALDELRLRDRMTVVTKVAQMANEGITAGQADRIVEDSVTRSLRNLRLDVIPVCLFHLEGNFLRYADSLAKLRDRGLVRYIGSSVNFPGPAREILASGRAEAMQAPTSVLDHRFTRAGIPRLAVAGDAALFVRSIFLQGLLLMPEGAFLPEHAPVLPVRRALQAIAGDAGMGLAELAVRYLLALEGVVSLVVGVDTVEQLRENLGPFDRGPLPQDVRALVERTVPDLPDVILFPGNWSKRMPDVKPAQGG